MCLAFNENMSRMIWRNREGENSNLALNILEDMSLGWFFWRCVTGEVFGHASICGCLGIRWSKEPSLPLDCAAWVRIVLGLQSKICWTSPSTTTAHALTRAYANVTVYNEDGLDHLCLRPYALENTGSRPISEVKLVSAQSVLRWGTTREYWVL